MTIQLRDFKLRQRQSASGRKLPSQLPDRLKTMMENANTSFSEKFTGVTTNGIAVPGLFSIENTGVSTSSIKDASDAFLGSLTSEQRANTLFPIDSDAWQRWSNIHIFLMRHGTSLDDMSLAQRDLALALLKESLSPSGFALARDVMRLNGAIEEITGKHDEYGEWLYWLSIMGTPSLDKPWGWQIDGHHLIINCFILAGQLVMTPLFMGSEPVAVDTGKYAGTRVFQIEEQAGLTLAESLTSEQRSKAIISEQLPREVFTTAFRDNFELKYEGIRYDELAGNQQALMLDLIGTYVNRMPQGHAQVKMEEVKKHLSETYLAWMGGMDKESVFYYRIHSPVILIEFDHMNGIALDNDEPTRDHIHTVVRTPNGNDYGKDLLRQHLEQVNHSHS